MTEENPSECSVWIAMSPYRRNISPCLGLKTNRTGRKYTAQAQERQRQVVPFPAQAVPLHTQVSRFWGAEPRWGFIARPCCYWYPPCCIRARGKISNKRPFLAWKLQASKLAWCYAVPWFYILGGLQFNFLILKWLFLLMLCEKRPISSKRIHHRLSGEAGKQLSHAQNKLKLQKI